MKRRVKVLHTADWHLGLVSWKMLGGVDRQVEQRECLEKMIEQARTERVDVIVHAGDLFHQYHQPPRETIRLAIEALMELKTIAPVVWVIGNHDWYAIDALKNVFPKDIFIVRDFTPLTIPDRPIKIFPLPYLSLARFLGTAVGENIQDEAQERLRAQMRTWESHFDPDYWHILVAHLSVDELASHYAEANLTREIFIKPADIPSGIDYAAFGHLHGFISYNKCSFPLFYPSSLVLDTFLREDQVAGYLIVELEEGKKPQVHSHSFESCRLITIPVHEEIALPDLREAIEKQALSPRNYIRIRVSKKVIAPEFYRELKQLCGDHWQVVTVETMPIERENEFSSEAPEVTTNTIPVLFETFCREKEFSSEVVELFLKYYQELLSREPTDETE